jgi:hypothetical protein
MSARARCASRKLCQAYTRPALRPHFSQRCTILPFPFDRPCLLHFIMRRSYGLNSLPQSEHLCSFVLRSRTRTRGSITLTLYGMSRNSLHDHNFHKIFQIRNSMERSFRDAFHLITDLTMKFMLLHGEATYIQSELASPLIGTRGLKGKFRE